MKYVVYEAVFQDKMRYVGMTSNLETRIKRHRSKAGGSVINRHTRRSNLQPVYNVVESGLTKEQARCIENIVWQRTDKEYRLSRVCPSVPVGDFDLPPKWLDLCPWLPIKRYKVREPEYPLGSPSYKAPRPPKFNPPHWVKVYGE